MQRAKHWIGIAIALLFAACSSDDEHNEQEPPMTLPSFSYEQGAFASTDLPYRKACFDNGSGEASALVIYLHGGTSKGNDNTTQMEEAGIDSIYNYLAAHAMNATFVVPQCPADKSWGGAMNAVLKGLIEHCISDGSIDSGQLYIFGGSMGGTGTWEMLSDYPGLFAAAMPVAANPSRCNAESTAQTPVFTVMGTEDKIMDIQVVSDFIDELTCLGNENVFEIADGWTHEITCIESYTTQRMDWVFAHRK